MTADLTQQLPQNDSEKLTLILTIVQSLTIRVDNIDTRLRGVEKTMDESRPLWQRLAIDVEHLNEGQHRLEEGYRRLEEGQEALRSDLLAFRKRVDYRFMILSGTVLSKYRDLEQRVTILELNSNPPNSQT
jgi:hypothetical protein